MGNESRKKLFWKCHIPSCSAPGTDLKIKSEIIGITSINDKTSEMDKKEEMQNIRIHEYVEN